MKQNQQASSWLGVAVLIFVVILSLYGTLTVQKKTNEFEKVEFIQGGDIQKQQTIDSLQSLVDSLYGENYPCQIELSRYQTAFQIFVERNPKAAEQYATIISDETE